MNSIQAVVLAAGKSTRFGEFFNKLLIPLCGKPLITHITDILNAHAIPSVIVVGHLREKVIETITDSTQLPITFVAQEEPLGTGHALLCSRVHWHADNILVLNGDMPLITMELIDEIIQTHRSSNAAVTFVTSTPDTINHAYGRVIEHETGIHIVEARDFNGDINITHPVNAGIYLFKRSFLEVYASDLHTDNAQKQLYITDLIGVASRYKLGVHTIHVSHDIVRGVNTLLEFSAAAAILYKRTALYWLNHDVLVESPSNTYIDVTVHLKGGTCVGTGVHIKGASFIGSGCTIHPYTIIENSRVENEVTILSHSVIHNSIINARASVGPFAHVNNTSAIELKKNTIQTVPPFSSSVAL